MDFIWFFLRVLNLYTDFFGLLGYGVIFGYKWFYGEWFSTWIFKNIIVFEMFFIVFSVVIWVDRLVNRCVLFYIDNMVLSEVINNKIIKDKELLIFVRVLVLYCLRYNIFFKVVYLSGIYNNKVDVLLRL